MALRDHLRSYLQAIVGRALGSFVIFRFLSRRLLISGLTSTWTTVRGVIQVLSIMVLLRSFAARVGFLTSTVSLAPMVFFVIGHGRLYPGVGVRTLLFIGMLLTQVKKTVRKLSVRVMFEISFTFKYK